MTNQELYKAIKNLDRKLDDTNNDIKDLSKEFWLFKGKAFGFISLLSIVFTFLSNYLVKKL